MTQLTRRDLKPGTVFEYDNLPGFASPHGMGSFAVGNLREPGAPSADHNEVMPGYSERVYVLWAPPTYKQVIYVAHPISGDPIGNCLKVVQWIRWLTNNDPTRVYVAPYVAEVLAFPSVKSGDERWKRALNDDESVISKLDGIVLTGGVITSGMQRELDCARREHKYITDLSRYRTPDDLEEGFFLDPASEA